MKNRVIKFRVWDNIDQSFWKQSDSHFVLESETGYVWKKDLFFFLNKPERYIIQQFTGLFDKNGKEIYEGDILQNDWNTVTQVKFGDFQVDAGDALFDGNGFFLLNIKDKEENSLSSGDTEKIVGSIFENTELVK
jgi:uncharacterized phage protein (TIGR01671 family)